MTTDATAPSLDARKEFHGFAAFHSPTLEASVFGLLPSPALSFTCRGFCLCCFLALESRLHVRVWS